MASIAQKIEYQQESFPSLDDSPLWADDFSIPRELQVEETPPLIVIRAQYPRIARSIEAMWGAPELDEYFHKLVIDDRRDRSGFPKDVLAAILKLSAEHAKRFRFERKKGIFDQVGADRFQFFAHR